MLLVSAMIAGTALASEAKPKEDKQGILIASFGTSMPEAKKAIDNLVDSTKKAFPTPPKGARRPMRAGIASKEPNLPSRWKRAARWPSSAIGAERPSRRSPFPCMCAGKVSFPPHIPP